MSYSKIKELVRESKCGSKVAMGELIKTYDKMIRRYVTSYFVKGYDEDDLEQIARITLMKAVNSYKEDTGANFTGFLDVVLRNTFNTMINKKENTVCTVSLNSIVKDDCNESREYLELLESNVSIEEDFEHKESKVRLRKRLRLLSQEEREIIIAAHSGHGALKSYGERKGLTYASCVYKKNRVLEKLKRGF